MESFNSWTDFHKYLVELVDGNYYFLRDIADKMPRRRDCTYTEDQLLCLDKISRFKDKATLRHLIEYLQTFDSSLRPSVQIQDYNETFGSRIEGLEVAILGDRVIFKEEGVW
jgi:hypothetical protein